MPAKTLQRLSCAVDACIYYISMFETLKTKPDYIKKIIAFVVSGSIFVVIAIVWYSSFGARYHGEETRSMALSPLLGVSAMFNNKVFDLKEYYTANFFYSTNTTDKTVAAVQPVSTSTPTFDFSGIVVLDSATTTVSSATSTDKNGNITSTSTVPSKPEKYEMLILSDF